MEGDGGLAGTRATLHDEQLVDRRPDHVVLLGLDRGDDLAHRAGALGTDLGEHGVGDAAGDVGRVGVVEVLVEVGGELAIVEHEAPPQVDAERVGAGRPVERRGDRRPPVDDDGIVLVVLDVAATDVPVLRRAARSVAGVDAPEEVTGAGRAEVLQRLLDRDLHVLGRELVGRALRVDRARGARSSGPGTRARRPAARARPPARGRDPHLTQGAATLPSPAGRSKRILMPLRHAAACLSGSESDECGRGRGAGPGRRARRRRRGARPRAP